MSKNLTRKGLAFGALVALGSSVFAGTPALAADSVVLAGNYSADTTLAAPITGTYTLNASLAPGSTAANIAQLKYKIVTDGTFVLSVAAGTGNVAVNGATAAATSYTNNTTSVTGVTTGVFGASGTVKTTSYVALATTPSASVANTLTLGVNAVPDATVATTGVAPTGASATRTATVSAFLDSNNNNLLDSGETAQTVDVKFVKHSEITATTTITAPIQGDTTVTALVKYTNVNNQALTAANLGAYFTKGDGTALVAADGPFAIASGATNTNTVGSQALQTATTTWNGTTPVVQIAGVTPTTLNGTYTTTAATNTLITFPNTTATGTTTTAGTVKRINSGVVKFAAAYSTTKGGFEYTTGTVDALAKGSAVSVQPLLGTTTLGVADFASSVATAANASVTARKVTTFTADTVTSTTAAAATAALNVAATDVALNKEYQVEFVAKDSSTTPVGVAGVPVSVSVVSARTLSSTVTLAVNGTTYTANTALPGATGIAKVAATTDANGKVVVTLKGTGLTDGDDVTVTAVAENFTADIITNNAASTFTTSYVKNAPHGVAVTTDGAATSLEVVVRDQFGANAPDSTYDVTATFDSAGAGYVAQATTASTSTSGTYVAVVGGKATLTITDNGTGAGVNVYDIDLKTKASNGVYSATAAIVANFQVRIETAADSAAGAVKLTATAGGSELGTSSSTDLTYVLQSYVSTTSAGLYGSATGYTANSNAGATPVLAQLSTSAFGNYDSRNVIDAVPTETIDAQNTNTPVTAYGTVYSASTATYAGVPVPNAKVTISAAGLLFKTTGQGTLYGDGSLVVYADANGRFSFTAASHLAGKQTVTITSGAGTSKLYLYFAEAAATAASSVTVKVADGASQFQAGRALDVVFTVTDKYGNKVATGATGGAADTGILTIAQTGSGYLATTGKVQTSATGTYTTKLITNAGDLGTSTITATIDLSTDVAATASSEFGVTDADVTVGGRALYASVEFAKGKTVTVTVDGKRLYSKLQSTDNYTELKFTQKTAGKHVVTIRVSGGIVYSETVVTTK